MPAWPTSPATEAVFTIAPPPGLPTVPTRRAPSRATARAAARPIPGPPPVTIATLPSRLAAIRQSLLRVACCALKSVPALDLAEIEAETVGDRDLEQREV